MILGYQGAEVLLAEPQAMPAIADEVFRNFRFVRPHRD
jgi:hypothetical protein